MSTDGEASNRLSDALDQIFSRSSGGSAPSDTDQVDDVPDEPYEMPDIVPATEEVPAAAAPTLPARAIVPEQPTGAPTQPTSAQPASSPTVVQTAAPSTTTPSATTPSPGSSPATATPASAAPATSWADHVTAVPAAARSTGLRAPGRKPRVRRVTRVLRHIDPWSTFKVALLFSLVTYLVALTSGVLLWRVADSTGTLDNVERWFTQFGWETFELKGGEVFHNAWIIGLFGVVAMTGGLVLLATVFNLVSDIIGGVRLTVLEEEVVERTVSSTRRYVVRQGAAAGGASTLPSQSWDVDSDPEPGDPRSGGAERDVPVGADPVADEARQAAGVTPAAPTADWSVED